jgi:anti-sigma B factor antagonist
MKLSTTELTDNVLKIEPEVARIDSSVAAKFKEQLLEKINSGNQKIILDLNQVKFIDSSGLGVIVATFKKLKGNGKLVILTKSQSILTMFKITRLDKVLPIVNSDDIMKALILFKEE